MLRLFLFTIFFSINILSAKAQVFNWTGFYAGVHGGHGNFYASPSISDLNPEGVVFGFQAGYNFQRLQNLVVSAEIDISKTNMSNYAVWARYPAINYAASARLRSGIAINRTLFFVSGGLAYAEILGSPYAPVQSKGDVYGFVGTIGIEHAFTSQWSTRLEYLFYRFDISEINEDYIVRIGRVALSYHF